MTVNATLLALQQELKAPKNLRNNFAGFDYRSAEGILEALKPLLKKHGVLLTLTDELVHVGDHNYVKATARLSDSENSAVEVSAYAREEESLKGQIAAQITGGCSSYARKYALNGMFLIDDSSNDIDGKDHTQHVSEPKQLTGVMSDQQKKLIATLLERKGITKTDMVQHLENEYGIIPNSEMTKQDASNIIKDLMEN